MHVGFNLSGHTLRHQPAVAFGKVSVYPIKQWIEKVIPAENEEILINLAKQVADTLEQKGLDKVSGKKVLTAEPWPAKESNGKTLTGFRIARDGNDNDINPLLGVKIFRGGNIPAGMIKIQMISHIEQREPLMNVAVGDLLTQMTNQFLSPSAPARASVFSQSQLRPAYV